jgi:hypothetical protein
MSAAGRKTLDQMGSMRRKGKGQRRRRYRVRLRVYVDVQCNVVVLYQADIEPIWPIEQDVRTCVISYMLGALGETPEGPESGSRTGEEL